MSVDIHVRLVTYNTKTKEWISPILYKKNKVGEIEPVYPWGDSGKNYQMFDIMSGGDCYFPFTAINEDCLPIDLKKEISDNEGCYGFAEVNLADMKNYAALHSKVENDYYGEDTNEKRYIRNPIFSLIEEIEQYLTFAWPLWDFNGVYSKIRVIYWFDR